MKKEIINQLLEEGFITELQADLLRCDNCDCVKNEGYEFIEKNMNTTRKV